MHYEKKFFVLYKGNIVISYEKKGNFLELPDVKKELIFNVATVTLEFSHQGVDFLHYIFTALRFDKPDVYPPGLKEKFRRYMAYTTIYHILNTCIKEKIIATYTYTREDRRYNRVATDPWNQGGLSI